MSEAIDKPEAGAAQTQAPAEPRKPPSPAAQRALAEAQERRRQADTAAKAAPIEINGRGGLDPVRYGDWESKGIISDF